MKKQQTGKLASKELNAVIASHKNYDAYSNISNIKEIGILLKMYRSIYGGHKKRASKLFGQLPTFTRSQLPKWVINYFVSENDMMTYEQWKLFICHVRKGEKSYIRNPAGQCLFSKKQTNEYKNKNRYPEEEDELIEAYGSTGQYDGQW